MKLMKQHIYLVRILLVDYQVRTALKYQYFSKVPYSTDKTIRTRNIWKCINAGYRGFCARTQNTPVISSQNHHINQYLDIPPHNTKLYIIYPVRISYRGVSGAHRVIYQKVSVLPIKFVIEGYIWCCKQRRYAA